MGQTGAGLAMQNKTAETNVYDARDKTANVLDVDHRVNCVFVYPAFSTLVQTHVTSAWLDQIDAVCTMRRTAAYIQRKNAPDLIALYLDTKETETGCYIESSTFINKNCVLVGMADDSGDVFCGVNLKDIDVEWVHAL